MLNVLKILGLILLLLVIIQTVAVVNFRQFAQTLHIQVANAPTPVLSQNPVPALIRNYVTRAGVSENNLARVITLTQTAQMRLKRGGDWQPLTAKQTISTGISQFVWQAEQYRGPLLMFRVIDGFIAGEGRLNVRLFGSIPVADYSGPDANRGEAMRYLAELIWAPDAMLGNPNLKWQEISDTQIGVELMLSDGPVQVIFHFNDEGDIIEATAKNRPATDDQGNTILLDWVCKVITYEELGGRRIPTRAEVGYIYADGYEAYWKGEITSLALVQ